MDIEMKPEEITYKCELCNREFNSKEAIDMHNKTKHSNSNFNRERKTNNMNFKKIRNSGILVFILILAIWGIYTLMTSPNSYEDLSASEINIGSHKNIALHLHSNLKILIDGQENSIPSNIGVSTGIMRPLHTHDSSGEIHIEGPYARDFTIGEFFEIWGRTFNSTCIFEYCTSTGMLTMSVNDIKSQQFENYVFRNNDEIVIEYDSFE